MKIGIVNFDIVPAGVNELLHVILPELLREHQLTGIEIDHYDGDVQYKTFTEKNVIESRNLYKRLLKSSRLIKSNMYKLFLPFDSVIIIGSDESLKVMENVTELVEGTKFLFVPVSIHNDIHDSELSLGYDSAINSIVGSILKIRDTIDSLKYSKPRLFGVQIPGNAPNQMLKELAFAVDGYYLPNKFDLNYVKQLEKNFNACFDRGQTYSFLIFNETVQPETIKETVISNLDVDWKVNQIDEALCIGQSPTAMDRIIAMKLAQQLLGWVKSDRETGKLLVRSRQASFHEKQVI